MSLTVVFNKNSPYLPIVQSVCLQKKLTVQFASFFSIMFAVQWLFNKLKLFIFIAIFVIGNQGRCCVLGLETSDNKLNKFHDTYIYLSLFAVLCALGMAFMYVIWRKQEKRLLSKNKLYSIQNKQLESNNEIFKRFFFLISHDLVHPYHSVLGYSKLLNTNFDELSVDHKKYYLGRIHETLDCNYHFITNLLEWSKKQMDHFEINIISFDLAELIEELKPFFQLRLESKNLQLDNCITRPCLVETDREILKVILTNIISNAIKFTPSNGRIEIFFNSACQMVTVKDNGGGIEERLLNELNVQGYIGSKDGTNKEKGSGYGLPLCFYLLDLIDGSILFNSELNRGTTVEICLSNEKGS